MAEQIHYRPAEARQFRPETEAQFEHLQGRLAEVNALLDELHDSGILRWLKDFAGAFPQISNIAVEGMNTPQGHAGMRNLLVIAKQLGKVDPDQLERLFAAANAGIEQASRGATGDTYDPPGITGVFRLLRDKELWDTLAPAIAGIKAFSAARSRDADTPGSDGNGRK